MTFTKREVKERMYNDYIYKQNQIIHFNFQNKIWFIVFKKKKYIYIKNLFLFLILVKLYNMRFDRNLKYFWRSFNLNESLFCLSHEVIIIQAV